MGIAMWSPSIERSLKAVVLLVLVGASFLPVDSPSGSAASTLADLRSGTPVVIAIANSPPQMMLDADGTPTGAGPEIDRVVLREIGVTRVRAQVMSYGSMIPAIQAHRVTLASGNGLVIKPARCATILFSDPVICSGEAFVVPRRLIGKLRTYHDLVTHGIRLGVCGGCVQQQYALDAGVRSERITVFSDEVNGLKMLLQGRIDALAIDSATAISVQKRAENPELTSVVPIAEMPRACAAAAFVDPALRDAYNAGLRRIRQTGDYLQILKRFDLAANAVVEGTASTAELCR